MTRDEAPRLVAAEAFAFLLGSWTLERVVEGMAAMEGVLTIHETGAGEAEYCERVEVTTAEGAVFGGSQRYVVTRTDEGFALWLADTRALFEAVSLTPTADGGLVGAAEHRCGVDVYRSMYTLGPGRRFAVRHAVTGPRKDYVSQTTFAEMRSLE